MQFLSIKTQQIYLLRFDGDVLNKSKLVCWEERTPNPQTRRSRTLHLVPRARRAGCSGRWPRQCRRAVNLHHYVGRVETRLDCRSDTRFTARDASVYNRLRNASIDWSDIIPLSHS